MVKFQTVFWQDSLRVRNVLLFTLIICSLICCCNRSDINDEDDFKSNTQKMECGEYYPIDKLIEQIQVVLFTEKNNSGRYPGQFDIGELPMSDCVHYYFEHFSYTSDNGNKYSLKIIAKNVSIKRDYNSAVLVENGIVYFDFYIPAGKYISEVDWERVRKSENHSSSAQVGDIDIPKTRTKTRDSH